LEVAYSTLVAAANVLASSRLQTGVLPGDEGLLFKGFLIRPGTNRLRCILVPTALDKALALAGAD
jgi:hypothetical protein